ncbi:MAG: hypothetical protein VKL42_01665 [Snowella sp.]|nr:hypothetical protein [Snowella sp.]
MGALPSGYKSPSSNGVYATLQPGSNKFRILSDIIVGWESWVGTKEEGNRKPVRARFDERRELPEPTDPRDRVKFFWAMVVWNYRDEQIQILQLTQRTIQKALEELEANEDWADLRNFDITITKQGEGLKTEYGVTPSPAKALPIDIEQEYALMSVNLDALYIGGDPFETTLSDEADAEITTRVKMNAAKKYSA